MLNLVLVLESACVGTSGRKGRDEDVRCGAQRLELLRPLGGVVGDDGGELGLRSAGGSLRGAAGDGIDATNARVGEEAGEDVGALFKALCGV